MRLVARSVSSRSRYGGRGVRRPRREAARVRAPAPTGTIARGDQALANRFRRSPCLTVGSAPCLSNEPRTHQGCELPAGARARRAGQGQRRARVFEATADLTQGTNAAFLSKVGERTPVFVRFSAVAGEMGQRRQRATRACRHGCSSGWQVRTIAECSVLGIRIQRLRRLRLHELFAIPLVATEQAQRPLLVPSLSRRSREDADVLPQQDDSIPVAEHPLERSAS
jgi:Catalase